MSLYPVVSAAQVHESILRKRLWDEYTRTPRFPVSYKQIPFPLTLGSPCIWLQSSPVPQEATTRLEKGPAPLLSAQRRVCRHLWSSVRCLPLRLVGIPGAWRMLLLSPVPFGLLCHLQCPGHMRDSRNASQLAAWPLTSANATGISAVFQVLTSLRSDDRLIN